ncbi:hypothetical protein KAR91_03730, partial [Candidatus Pacearchaeota archaeon]|nr:hypothetical protein [Candidatus Pacearchaeota archaeon]
PAITEAAAFTVNWTGQDNVEGSGVSSYDIYVSTDGGDFTLWDSFTDTSAVFTGEDGHSYAFYSIARDNAGHVEQAPADADATTTIHVPGSNNPPVFEPIGDKDVDEGQLLTFTVNAIDPDGDEVAYTAQPLPDGAEFTGDTFTWTPSFSQAGDYDITFTADDGQGLDDTMTITITVNDIPIVTALEITGPSQVDENTTAGYTCMATYDDGSVVNVTSSATWQGNSGNASISGGVLAASEVSSDQQYQITASYEGFDAQADITIINIPKPPVLDPIGDKTVNEDSMLSFTVSASDPDSVTITYSAEPLPDGASLVGNTFSWTPSYDQAGMYQVTFVVNDEVQLTDDEMITIIVNNVNRAPIADAGANQEIPADVNSVAQVTLDGSGSSDPDGDDINCFWFLGETIIATGVNPTIELPLGDHTIALIVDDGTEYSEPDYVIVSIQDVTPPELTLSATPDVLWPPNHKMVEVTPGWTVNEDCTVVLYSITMNEGKETNTYEHGYDDTQGDGHTLDDIQVDADGKIYLRAERSGKGDGRVYTITYKATDAAGNETQETVTVTVPHSQP